MTATVTWLGGQGDERRQPRLGVSNPEDANFCPAKEAWVFFAAPSAEIAPPQDAKLSALALEPYDHL